MVINNEDSFKRGLDKFIESVLSITLVPNICCKLTSGRDEASLSFETGQVVI